MQTLNNTSNIHISAMAIIKGLDPDMLAVYARYIGLQDADDACCEAPVEVYDAGDARQNDLIGVCDDLEVWLENQHKQQGELGTILKRCPTSCATTAILRSLDAE
jgi:hypothetical protein